MDEPLSNLDANFVRNFGLKFVESKNNLVSPQFILLDQEEALAVSDLICVLNEGQVQQTGSPIEMCKILQIFCSLFCWGNNFIEVGKLNQNCSDPNLPSDSEQGLLAG